MRAATNCSPAGSPPGATGMGSTSAASPAQLIAVEKTEAVLPVVAWPLIWTGPGSRLGQAREGEAGVAIEVARFLATAFRFR